MAFKTTSIFHFWSSNSAQPSSRPYIMQTCDCLHYHVFTCVVRLTHMFHVWVPRRRLYDSSALHIVGGNYTHFPPVLISTVWGLHSVPTYISTRCSTHIPCHKMRPTGWDPLCSLPDAPFSFLLGLREVPYFTSWPWFSSFSSRPSGFSPGETPSETKPSAVYAAIGIYHWILFAMLYTLRKIFHQSTSVASYWQKTDIIHMNSKAWLWVNGPWFLFSSPQALQTSWELLFPFLIRVHYTLPL